MDGDSNFFHTIKFCIILATAKKKLKLIIDGRTGGGVTHTHTKILRRKNLKKKEDILFFK